MAKLHCFSIVLVALICSASTLSIDLRATLGLLGLQITSCVGVTCQNGGQCKLSDLGTAYCACPYGFSGTRCEMALDLTPAEGQCPALSSFGVCPYGSECNPAHSDHDCSTGYKCCLARTGCDKYVCKKPVKVSCSNIQCLNGGACVIDGGNAYCSCPPGYSGESCETATTRVEPGTCPAPAVSTSIPCSADQCSSDSDCQIGTKCCSGPLSCGNKLCVSMSSSSPSPTDACGGCPSGKVCTTFGCLSLIG